METIVDIGNCVVIAEEVGNCTFKQGLKKEKIISTRQLLTYKYQLTFKTNFTSFQKQIDKTMPDIISEKYIQVSSERKETQFPQFSFYP